MTKLMILATACAFVGLILAVPFIVIHGWIRWIKCGLQRRPFTEELSLMSLALSSSACALAALACSGLLRRLAASPVTPDIFIWIGGMLSVLALMFALFGIWRRTPYRWQGFLSGLGMLLFWFLWFFATALRDIPPGF